MSQNQNDLNPFLSIIIPTYNSEKYIERTLLSVFNQTYDRYEVIVSDDGSCDKTTEVVKDIFHRFPGKETRLLINEHKGPSMARNKGIESAKNEWIAFLDSDDLWLPQKLQRVAGFIVENPEVNLICHNEIWKRDAGDVLFDYANNFDRKIHPFLSLYRRNTLSASATVIKKELLIRAGLFDPEMPSAQDYDLWLRIAMLPDLKIKFIDEALGFYFTTEGNISSNIEKRLDCLLRIKKKYNLELKEVSKHPFIERLRFEGIWYAWAGWQLLRRKYFKKGIIYFIIGIIKWPFRYNRILKSLKSIKA